MKIIDNLREYVLTAPSICSTTRAILVGYLDNIEREVKELADERDMLKRQWEAGVDFDQRLESCADNREDVTLFGVDYIALPVDADGMPIHVGDVLDEGKVAKVVLTDEHWEPSVYVYKLPNVQHEYFCSEVTHHHAPTVEDVLRDYWHGMDAAITPNDMKAMTAEYAAKLRLAGDE